MYQVKDILWLIWYVSKQPTTRIQQSFEQCYEIYQSIGFFWYSWDCRWINESFFNF